MAYIRINATDAGFFNLSPLGAALAPNVFLKTAVNIDGTAQTIGSDWQSRESAMYDSFGIDVFADVPAEDFAKLGEQAQIEVSGISYFRIEGGEKTVTATLELPLTLTAVYDEISAGTYGWTAEAGDTLEKLLQTEGYLFNGGNGDDIFAPHHDILPTYASNILKGRGGDDQLTGSLGDDKLLGGTGDDTLRDFDGENFLHGQSGDDLLELGDGSDGSLAKGGLGDDTLISGAGDDTLRGGGGADTLIGGRGDDALFGGQGDDVLTGGRGTDFLKGHAGADQFIFNTEDSGYDIIADFTDAEDLIILQGLESFADLSVVQQANSTHLSWGGDSDLTLNNFDADLLDASDFMFL